jgi:GldM C-terminal domain
MMPINKIPLLSICILACFFWTTIKAQPSGVVMNKYDSLLYEGVLSNKIVIKKGFYNVTTDNGVIILHKNWFFIKPKKEGACNIFLRKRNSSDTITLSVKQIPTPMVLVVPQGENGGKSIKHAIALVAQCQNCEIDLQYKVLSFNARFYPKNDSVFVYHNPGSVFSKRIRSFFKKNLNQFSKIEFIDIKVMLPTKKKVIHKEMVHANLNDSPW